jgi:hypothetical protein
MAVWLYVQLETTLFLNASGDLLAALAGSLDKEAGDLRSCSSTMLMLPEETAVISSPDEDPGFFCSVLGCIVFLLLLVVFVLGTYLVSHAFYPDVILLTGTSSKTWLPFGSMKSRP